MDLLSTGHNFWCLGEKKPHGTSLAHHGTMLPDVASWTDLQGAFAERLLDKDALFIPAFATTFLGVVYMTLRLQVIHSAGTFRMITVADCSTVKWVCLKMGYAPNYRNLIGIMISKTIGFRGLAYFQTNPNGIAHEFS